MKIKITYTETLAVEDVEFELTDEETKRYKECGELPDRVYEELEGEIFQRGFVEGTDYDIQEVKNE